MLIAVKIRKISNRQSNICIGNLILIKIFLWHSLTNAKVRKVKPKFNESIKIYF